MYKIMIADDEPIVLDSLKTFPWSDHQCCVTCFAENGLNALHTLESEKVDILISDIRMPGMNGLELSKAVKERSRPDIRDGSGHPVHPSLRLRGI